MTILEILAAWFLLSLTGALAPGPLSAAVIQNAAKRGRLFGILPMVGHAIVEIGIIAVIIISVHALVLTPFMISLIMGAGGLVVIFFGLLALRDYRYSVEQLETTKEAQDNSVATAASATVQGALVSILSPYFLLWWFTIGLSTVTVLMVDLQVGGGTVIVAGILVYLTHISTDFIYGAFLSLGTDKARKRANVGGINWLNIAVGIFQVALGIWFIIGSLNVS
ncbi:MAG: LysE family transporter [Candidatus Thorarchaeota archaeon]